MNIYAYCWANGLIGFAKEVPNGALGIASGEEEQIRSVVAGLARLSYTGDLLIPKMPEETDPTKSIDLLCQFSSMVRKSLGEI
jgi:hypothetical protein